MEAPAKIKIYMDEQGYRWSCQHRVGCGMGWNLPSREQTVERAQRHHERKHSVTRP